MVFLPGGTVARGPISGALLGGENCDDGVLARVAVGTENEGDVSQPLRLMGKAVAMGMWMRVRVRMWVSMANF